MKLPTNQPNIVPACRARKPVWTFIIRLAVIAGSGLAISAKANVPATDLPNFDNLANFAQLGNSIDVHNATVNGNEGVSSDGTLDLDKPGTINGNVYEATGATFDQVGDLNGSLFTDQDLTTEQNTVFSASSALDLLPAVQVSGDQTTSATYDVPAGQVEVVDLKENNVVNGQIFLPNAEADLDSTFFGAIYSGDQNVELMANATLNAVPLPEPGTMVLMSAGFVSFIVWARRRLCSPKT